MRIALMTAFLLAVGFVGTTPAADEKANPTGTWKWETEFNGQKRTSTLKLKLDGDKLTGAMVGRNDMETKIDDGKFKKDGEISFKVTREFNGNKITINYSGKITGDVFKGKIEMERDGEKITREFEAKRDK